jgi:hypothetical protein
VEEVGPAICPSDSFSITSSDLNINVVAGNIISTLEDSDNEIDLTTEGAHIFSDFGEEVDWKLNISNGTQEKNYSGTSAKLDVYWYGQPDKFLDSKLQFDEGNITVSLTVVCHDAVQKSFNLIGEQNFSSLNSQYGFLLRDWDKNGVFPVLEDSFNGADGWAGGANALDSWDANYYDDVFSSPAGGKYMQLHGYGTGSYWYLGGTSIDMSNFSDLVSTENLDSLYLNVLVSAEDGAINTGSQIALKAAGKTYLRLEDINWRGWKMLSYKLSDFATSSGAKLSSINITTFVMQLGAQPEQSSDLKVRYDFVLFTVGAPLFEQ